MKLYKEEKEYKIYQGNSYDMLDVIEPNSIGSIVTDPPYGLTSITKRFGKENSAPAKEGKDGSFARLSRGFMGKTWDGTGIEYNVNFWKKCYQVLKPGGYLLAFGGTRTFHRIACAIEDAGFEIRDTIMWLYGSGFPKSHNVGLDIDKKLGCGNRGHRTAVANRFHPDGTLEPNGEKLPPYEAKTKEEEKWQGYGTCLKPSYEPIIVARKAPEGSIAENCLKYGVGALNIDECRVEALDQDNFSKNWTNRKAPAGFGNGMVFGGGVVTPENVKNYTPQGRFPANVITDGSDEVAQGMPYTSSAPRKPSKNPKANSGKGVATNFQRGSETSPYDDGSAMRYFYSAKASKKDRDDGLDMFEEKDAKELINRVESSKGASWNGKYSSGNAFAGAGAHKKNIHPTVKPTDLMQYLVRLVTPKGETILDPFCGSGSTGKAVMFENRERNANYKFIGIEMTEEYLPIIVARIEYALHQYEYEVKKVEQETGQISLF